MTWYIHYNIVNWWKQNENAVEVMSPLRIKENESRFKETDRRLKKTVNKWYWLKEQEPSTIKKTNEITSEQVLWWA